MFAGVGRVVRCLDDPSNDGDDTLVGGDGVLGVEARPLIVAPDWRQGMGRLEMSWHDR